MKNNWRSQVASAPLAQTSKDTEVRKSQVKYLQPQPGGLNEIKEEEGVSSMHHKNS